MNAVKAKRFLAVLLTLTMLVQAIAVCGFTISAAETEEAPDVVYEEAFHSGLWAVEPKTSKVNYDAYNPTAPTVEDGTMYLTEGNSAAFYWKNIPGVKETGTYTLSFDVDITDKGNNNTLFSGVTWKRELNVLLGGYATGINFRSDSKKILPAGSSITDASFASDTYSVTIVLDNTVSPNTMTTTLVKGDEINVTKSTTVDDTTDAYAECSPFWVFRCEDGAVEISNFTFTDGTLSIVGAEAVGESFLTTEGEGLWTVEPRLESSKIAEYASYHPTAPLGYNGKLYIDEGDGVAFWWKNIPDVKEKGIYTVSFNLDITSTGDNKSLITENVWKNELVVSWGSSWGAASFRSDTKKIFTCGNGNTENNFATETYTVTIVWNNMMPINSVTTTIKSGSFSASKMSTVDSTAAAWYEECSPFWSFRCEDGAVEISNFKLSVINEEDPVSTAEVSIPSGQRMNYECDLAYNGEAVAVKLGDYELFSASESGLSVFNSAVSGSYGNGTYRVKATVSPTQKLIVSEITTPDGEYIKRGTRMPAGNREFLLGRYGSVAGITGETFSYTDLSLDEFTVNTEEPVSEGFGANVYNIVTSFTDARYDRAFAWTALESFIGDGTMAIKYRASGASEWTVADAVREEETLSAVENYFEADLTGLTADTRYEYRVGKKDSTDEENDWSQSYYFTTAKETVGDFSFIAFGDNQGHSWAGSTSSNKGYMFSQTAITQALSKLNNPAFIVNTGDLTENNTPSEWNWYFKALGETATSVPHFATIGGGVHDNHDYFDMHFNHPNNGGKDAYTNTDAMLEATPTGADIVNYLDETVYSFNYGDLHFIVLDSGAAGHTNTQAIMKQQREWLAADLEANKDAKWKIVMTHQPAYKTGTSNFDASFLADLVEGYGVDLVLQGHLHHVSRTYPIKDGEIVTKKVTDVIEKGTGTVYTTIGPATVNHAAYSTAYMEKMQTVVNNDNLMPCYTVIDVKEDGLTMTVRQADGLVLDTFTITSGEQEPEAQPDVEVPGYGTLPAEYSDVAAYPYVAFMNGEFVGAAKTWATANTLAREPLDENNGATVNVLLRDDATISAAPASTDYLYLMRGTAVFDLGGHTLTVDKRMFSGNTSAGYTGDYASSVVVKNGTVLMNAYPFLSQNKQTQGEDKVVNITFENVTLKKLSASTQNQTFYAGPNVDATKNNVFNFTFNDCILDFGDNAKACYLFNFNRDNVFANIKINGGKMIAPASSTYKLTLSKLNSGSSFAFGKGSDGNYTTLELPEGVDAPTDVLNTNSFVTVDGDKVTFVKDGDVYKLAYTEFKIMGAYLNIANDINVTYAVSVPAGYESPYMVFEFGGKSYTVTDFSAGADGTLAFTFTGIAPQLAGDNIKATLYATKDGVEASVEKAEYSVLTYCKNMLNKTDDEPLRTLLSDLLVYAAASQTYADYKTDALVTEGLELTPSTFSPLTSTDKALLGESDARVEWKGVALRYENAMAMKLGFVADETLMLRVSVNGRVTEYASNAWGTDADGNAVVYFHGILATEYADVVTAAFYDGEEQVGQSVTYSVNSYVYSMQDADGALGALVQATYNYGVSAEIYAGK